MDMIVPYCAHEAGKQMVVPHHGERTDKDGEYQIEFWRVPTKCPLYEGSDEKCHPNKRSIVKFQISDIPRFESVASRGIE